eukprot:1157381-Pelagomonas_calceolata.AAC.2
MSHHLTLLGEPVTLSKIWAGRKPMHLNEQELCRHRVSQDTKFQSLMLEILFARKIIGCPDNAFAATPAPRPTQVPFKEQFWTFLKPFSRDLWLVLLFGVLFSSIFLYIVDPKTAAVYQEGSEEAGREEGTGVLAALRSSANAVSNLFYQGASMVWLHAQDLLIEQHSGPALYHGIPFQRTNSATAFLAHTSS